MICVILNRSKRLLCLQELRLLSVSNSLGNTDHNIASTPAHVLSDERKVEIKRVCSRYTPCRKKLLPFQEYIDFKRNLKPWRWATAVVTYFLVPCMIGSGLPVVYPRMLDSTPLTLFGFEGLDPMIIGGVGTVGIAVLSGCIVFWHYPNYVLWRRGAEFKNMYLDREKDFRRRRSFYRTTKAAQNVSGDDYYGDKVKDITDYRLWIRIQQQKDDN